MIWSITLNVDVILLWYEGGEGPFTLEQSFRFTFGGSWGPQAPRREWQWGTPLSRDTRYPSHLPDYWHTEEHHRLEVFVGEYIPPETNILDLWVPPDGFSDDERWNGR